MDNNYLLGVILAKAIKFTNNEYRLSLLTNQLSEIRHLIDTTLFSKYNNDSYVYNFSFDPFKAFSSLANKYPAIRGYFDCLGTIDFKNKRVYMPFVIQFGEIDIKYS